MAAKRGNSKNILVLIGGSYISGTEKVTLDIIEGLKRVGHNLFCVTNAWTDGEFGKQLEKLSIDYKALKLGWYYISKLRWSFESFLNYPKSFFLFYRVLKKNKFDLIYTTSYRNIVLLYPLLKSNVIYHVHDENCKNKFSRFFINRINRKVIKYIAVSNFIKLDLISCGISDHKIEVIHNGTTVVEEEKLQAMDGNSLFTIGVVGQIIPKKGHEDILKALKILREQGLDVSLIIVGRGSDLFIKELKSIIKNFNLISMVEWRGFKEDILDIYKDINVVIAVTRGDEPFGMIAIEANMLKLPVIASCKGGLVEIVIDKFNGYLVDTYNPEQIAEKIKKLYHNRSLLQFLGINGRQRVIEKFTNVKMISRIEELFFEL